MNKEEQMGFRKGKSTLDAVFALQKLIEERREYNQKIPLAYIDFEKDFDNV